MFYNNNRRIFPRMEQCKHLDVKSNFIMLNVCYQLLLRSMEFKV